MRSAERRAEDRAADAESRIPYSPLPASMGTPSPPARDSGSFRRKPVTANAGKCAARPCRARWPDNPAEDLASMRARASPDTRHSPKKTLRPVRDAYRNLSAYSILLRLIYARFADLRETNAAASRTRLDEVGVSARTNFPIALPGADGPRHEVNPDRRGRDCMREEFMTLGDLQ